MQKMSINFPLLKDTNNMRDEEMKTPTYFTQQNIMKRFFFVVGNTKDTFVDESLAILNIEEMLYNHLNELGYERIVFYSKAQKLYCYDDTSYQLVINPNQDVSKKPKALSKIAGPMGKMALSALKPTEQQDDNSVQSGVLHFSAMNDMDAFQRIDACMKDKRHKTAVIFTNAEDFIGFFGTVRTDRGSESIRANILDSINNYDGLGFDNDNIMLFVFPQRSFSETMEVYKNAGDVWVTHFAQEMRRGENVIEIGVPNAPEIRNAINYLRICRGLNVKITELDEICKLFAKTVFSKKMQLSSLMAELYLLVESHSILDKKHCERICGISQSTSALSKLNELIGMQSVKDQINAFVRRAEMNKAVSDCRYISRIDPQPITAPASLNMHFVLTGNPGTGKTTVAKLIGEILYDLGYLRGGHTVKVTRADLVAGYVGQTAIQTRKYIEEAMGGVLFVDEAYMLKRKDDTGNDFGQEAIDTILEAMSDRAGQFSVIVAGYPKEMQSFLSSNPGLPRRFNKEIRIEDYSPSEMMEIFDFNLRRKQFGMGEEDHASMSAFMENWFRSRDENWGNAGNIEKLIDSMYENWCVRSGERNESGHPIITLSDIPDNLQIHNKPITEAKKGAVDALNNLIGLSSVKERINELRRKIAFEGKTEPGHYIFAGNPGTGKTTVARLLGDIFCSIGVLRRGHVVEVSREDLVSEHVGGTAKKTKAIIEKALDGVLFIDEAYRLFETGTDHNYGQEAVDTLVAMMENNRNSLCVICAGYPVPMANFMNSNVGFKSRFNGTILFEDYSPDEMIQILCKFADDIFLLTPEYKNASKQVFELWAENKRPDFGNGRDVRKYFDASKSALYLRLEKEYGFENIPEEEKRTLTAEDIPEKYRNSTQVVTIPEAASLPLDILPTECTNNIADALILISVETANGSGFGSGFMMSENGYAITCNHVIANAKNIKVRIRISGRIGGMDTWHKATVVATDKIVDMALLKLEGENFPSVQMDWNNPIKRGQKIQLLGYPFGTKISDDAKLLDYSIFEGKVASIQKKNGYDTVFVDMQAKRGNSGGPVFDIESGKVIGILCGSQIEGDTQLKEEINYIRPIKYAKELFFEDGDAE